VPFGAGPPGLTLRRYERPLAERRLPDGLTTAAAARASSSPLLCFSHNGRTQFDYSKHSRLDQGSLLTTESDSPAAPTWLDSALVEGHSYALASAETTGFRWSKMAEDVVDLAGDITLLV
jgi:hypothetical protein